MGPEFSDDGVLVAALRGGDEAAFTWLLERYYAPLHRTARAYVATSVHADEVVQDTWVAVLRGIDDFEQRSSLKTWLYRILVNIARTQRVKESRFVPFSSAWSAQHEDVEPTFDPDRFRPPEDPEWPGHWATLPRNWEDQPESRLLAGETVALVGSAIDRLPRAQREVLTLRDVEGWSSSEVCVALGLTEVNQRVLLHRGRAKVRRTLETYFEGTPS